jgi:hypothetical protein
MFGSHFSLSSIGLMPHGGLGTRWNRVRTCTLVRPKTAPHELSVLIDLQDEASCELSLCTRVTNASNECE